MNKELPEGWIWVRHLHSGEIISIYAPNFPLENMKNDFEVLDIKVEDEGEVIPEPTPFEEAQDVPRTNNELKIALKKMGVMIPKNANKEELESLWREHI